MTSLKDHTQLLLGKKLRVVCCFLLATSSGFAFSANDRLIFSEDFNGGKPKGIQLKCVDESIRPGPIDGRSALKMTVNPRWPYGDKYKGVKHNCPIPWAMRLPRAEWKPGDSPGLEVKPNGHYWLGFDHKIPSDWENRKLVLWQTHAGDESAMDSCDTLNSPSPQLALRAGVDGKLVFGVRYVVERCYTNQRSQLKYKEFPLGNITKGKWVNYVVYMHLSHTNAGRITIWKDGDIVLEHSGPNFYNDTNRTLLHQLGQYFSSGMNGSNKPSTLYLDNVKMATGTDAYSLVSSVATQRLPPTAAKLKIE